MLVKTAKHNVDGQNVESLHKMKQDHNQKYNNLDRAINVRKEMEFVGKLKINICMIT